MAGSRSSSAWALGLGLRPPAARPLLQQPLPAPAARGSRGVRPLLCHSDGRTDSRPGWRLRLPGDSGSSQRTKHGRRRRSVSAGRSASSGWLPQSAPTAHRRGAQLPTQKGRSQFLSLMYRTDQNFPESAAFTHRRLHRPLHVPLPLPSSRAFSKDSTQWVAGPSGDGRGCHSGRKAAPALLAQAGQADPPTSPPALATRLFAVLIKRTMKNGKMENRNLHNLLVGDGVRPWKADRAETNPTSAETLDP